MKNKITLILFFAIAFSQKSSGYIFIGAGPVLAESVQLANDSRIDLEKKFFYLAGLSNQVTNLDFADVLWFGQIYYLNFEERRSSRTDSYTLYYFSLAPALRIGFSDQFGVLAKFQYNFYISDSYANNTSDPNHPFPAEQLTEFQSSYQLDLAIDYLFENYKLELTVVPYISDFLGNRFNDIDFKLVCYLTFYYSI